MRISPLSPRVACGSGRPSGRYRRNQGKSSESLLSSDSICSSFTIVSTSTAKTPMADRKKFDPVTHPDYQFRIDRWPAYLAVVGIELLMHIRKCRRHEYIDAPE